MVALLIAAGMVATTLYALRGGLVGRSRLLTFAGFDPSSALLGLLAVGAAIYAFGLPVGLAFVLSVMIHEFGHAAAYRVCGHADARFRLVPLIGGVAISNQLPASHEKAFFISLMGPGICLAPMVLCLALLQLDYVATSDVCESLRAFAFVTGALNFFNLMPFWPLDGGRLVAILLRTFLPAFANQAIIAIAAMTVVVAIYSRSFVFLVFALMGAQNLMMRGDASILQRPMGKRRGLIALGAYLATTAAFGLTGWPLLSGFF